jgi:hypothetical protein
MFHDEDLPEAELKIRRDLATEVVHLIWAGGPGVLWADRVAQIEEFVTRIADRFEPSGDRALRLETKAKALQLVDAEADIASALDILKGKGIVTGYLLSGVETLAEQHTKALERISQLEESETTWAGEDLRILRELAATMKDELQEGSYRDPLDERMANPWRKYFGLPRHFAVKPAPDCTKVRAANGRVFVEELRREPLGGPQQDRHVWRREDLDQDYFIEVPEFLRTFAPFVEVLDD